MVSPFANPGQLAMVLMAEAHTPYVAPLLRDESCFPEVVSLRKEQKIDEAHV